MVGTKSVKGSRRASFRRRTADALHSAAIHLLRRVRVADEQSGLSPARLSVMSVLVFAGPKSLADLARIEQVSPPTITKLIQALEIDGLVRRKVDPTDGRSFTIDATAKGRTLLCRARERRLDMILSMMNELSRPDVEQLNRVASLIESMVSVKPHD